MMKKLFSSLVLAAGIVAIVPPVTSWAQNSNSGFTIFSGIKREDILNYHLDFGGQAGDWDRYRLRIPSNKLPFTVTTFHVKYPDYYNGKFDTDEIEARIDGDPLPVNDITWNKEKHLVSISLKEPINPKQQVELVFSNVKNPRFSGTFYFNAQVDVASEVAIRRYVGTWIIDID